MLVQPSTLDAGPLYRNREDFETTWWARRDHRSVVDGTRCAVWGRTFGPFRPRTPPGGARVLQCSYPKNIAGYALL